MNVLTSITVLGFLIFFHEMGHFLGLWHPTEGNQYKTYGLYYDPISDTPECPESKNSNNDIYLLVRIN